MMDAFDKARIEYKKAYGADIKPTEIHGYYSTRPLSNYGNGDTVNHKA